MPSIRTLEKQETEENERKKAERRLKSTKKKSEKLNQKRILSRSFMYRKINPQIKIAIIAPNSSFILYPIKTIATTDSKMRAIGNM